MDSENNFIEKRETPERFPSKEEIRSLFETLIKGKKYKELGEKSDEKGMSFYEIEVPLENGERVEINYQRAHYNYKDLKNYPAGVFSASIHFTQYGTDDMPISGKLAANYINGVWKFYSEEIEGIF